MVGRGRREEREGRKEEEGRREGMSERGERVFCESGRNRDIKAIHVDIRQVNVRGI